MSLSTWLWGTSQLDDAIDKATSELLPAGAEDMALNLEICDQIRSKSVGAKEAMRALKRRLNHKNPNVQILALSLADVCIKNGGDHFLTEVASREFIDNLVSILKIPILNIDVKNSILRHVQNWSTAFEGKSHLSYVGQTYKTLQREGFNFPPKDMAVANSAMVDTQTAPEWIDSDVCLRCRTAFTFTNRKHHCRNCGQVFDQACSSKTIALPHYGITQEVRVCDGCYNKVTKKGERNDKKHRHSQSLHSPRTRPPRDFADAELQRAIQLSLQEVGAAGHSRPGYVPAQPSEPPLIDRTKRPSAEEEDDDPELRAAIEASLREANTPRPSAPIGLETPRMEAPSFSYSQSYPPTTIMAPPRSAIPTHDLEPLEEDAILTFNQTVEQVQAQGGRDMSRYPAVNELYDKASSLRPKLAISLDDAGRKEEMLKDMHSKLSEAVRLYDKLLTEQIAHPRWRAPSAQTPYQATPPVQSYQAPPPQTYRPAPVSYEPQSPALSYQPQPYAEVRPPPPMTASYAPSAPQQPDGMLQQSFQPISQMAYQPPTLSRQNTLASAPPPPSSQASVASSSPQQSWAAPAHSTPQPVMSPPPQQQAWSPAPQPQPQSVVSPAPAPQQQQYYPQQQQQQQQWTPAPALAQAPAQLPQFPIAPTYAPQAFPSVPTSVPEERKEALLIDL